MSSDSIKKRLSDLKDSISKAEAELEQIKILALPFPDLVVKSNKWGDKKFTSKMVTSMAVDFDTGYSCSCCIDSPLYAYPFVEFDGNRVYSNPDSIYIGERNCYVEGEKLYDQSCLDILKEQGFNDELIGKIRELVVQTPIYLGDSNDDEAEEDT